MIKRDITPSYWTGGVQNRPLDPVYPVLFVDAIHLKVRDGQPTFRPFYVVIGVTIDGRRDILGIKIVR